MAIKEIPFYNVTTAVGPSAPNKQTDVMLVQVLLKDIYSHPTLIARKPPGTMTVDGRFDPTTALWIQTFQKHALEAGLSIHPDGRVDPGRQDQRSSITRTAYTIQQMNHTYRRRLREQHNHLERAPGVPTPLVAELMRGET